MWLFSSRIWNEILTRRHVKSVVMWMLLQLLPYWDCAWGWRPSISKQRSKSEPVLFYCAPLLCQPSLFYEWMNEWMRHLYSALLCMVVHPKRFTIMWGFSPQPPPVCSIHLDDATAATGQRRQCAHHTPATGGEEREIEPIKWMGITRRPWLTRASGGNFGI